VVEKEAAAERLEAEIAEVCGVLHAATGRLVGLIGQVVETEAWQGWGIRSAEQWSEDSVAVISRGAPAATDAEVASLARTTTVTQLRRVLGKYSFDEPRPEPEPDPEPVAEVRRVSFNHTESGSWRLSAELPADEGAVVEKALSDVRDELFRAGEAGRGPGASPADVSWADALVAMAEKSLAAVAVERPHRDRSMVLVHLRADGGSHLHLGPGLGEGLGRFLRCDARVRAVLEAEGRPVSVGRAFRTVPDRTRIMVEDRDGGCRVPGCDRHRWLHVHHVQHWEDGGASDTANLVCLCQHHHRLHHRGGLGIEGDADEPDGIVFTATLCPRAPRRLRPATGYSPPANPSTRGPSTSTSRPSPPRADGRTFRAGVRPGLPCAPAPLRSGGRRR